MTEKAFATLPVRTIFLKLAVPNILSNLSVSLYFIADGIFVGCYIGSNALAAVNLVMPFLGILFALSDMIAIGASVKASLAMGTGDNDRARHIFSFGIFSTSALGFLFMAAGLLCLKPVLYGFIKDASLAALCHRYTLSYVFTFPLIMPFFALDNFLRVCGKAKYSMGMNITTSLLNILLDWFFIAHWRMGVEYSALASVISMATGSFFCLLPFLSHRLTLYFTLPRITRAEIFGIVYNGGSEFFANVSGSLLATVVNGLLLSLGGSLAVASYSIVLYLDTLLTGTLYAVTDAMQPPVSYNTGAGLMHRTNSFFKISCIATASVSLACFALMVLQPRRLALLFADSSDEALISLTITALLLFAPEYLFKWFNMVVSAFLTALDRPRESIIIMICQAIAFPLVCLVLLTPVFQVNGIFVSGSVSAAMSFVVSLLFWLKQQKRQRDMENLRCI